ncbi:MAG: hypothetical protein HY751_01925 [Nitrospinae bacterium]|nr:hypothetical protein [Nitrospinota bacterium]
MKDIEEQIAYVAGSVNRLLSQMDMEPLSPTYGCMHLAYWRDKTSDVADARRQEVMLPLAMLYRNEYPGSPWRGGERLKNAVIAAMVFWRKSLYADGSLDEWYKGERAFAAAAFTTFAVAKTLEVMGTDLPAHVIRIAREGLASTAGWLTRRNDLFKTNHQAVGVGALAFAGKILGDDKLAAAARKKLDSIIKAQTAEGWFPEVGHMDPGYTFLTVEYVAMAMDLWNDWSNVAPFIKAYDFACEWVHPDLRLGDEYGVCHNPYVSRIAAILMAPHSGRAAFLRERFTEKSAGFDSYKNTLGDELRLSRWAFQPLLAYEYARNPQSGFEKTPETLPLFAPSGKRGFYQSAKTGWFSGKNYTAVFAPAAGGLVRIFNSANGYCVADYGYALRLPAGDATNITYNRNLPLIEGSSKMMTEAPISVVKKFMPSFISRVGLRLACSTAIGSRLARMGIDVVRKRKGSALNQSSVNLAAGEGGMVLRRKVTLGETSITVEDELAFNEAVPTGAIMFYLSSGNGGITLKPVTDLADIPLDSVARRIEFTKRYEIVEDTIISTITVSNLA